MAYTITKKKIYTNVKFMIVARIKHCKLFFFFSADINFHDHFTYLTLFLFSADVGNATVSTDSKQVGLRHSHGVIVLFFGSEFSRHPEG